MNKKAARRASRDLKAEYREAYGATWYADPAVKAAYSAGLPPGSAAPEQAAGTAVIPGIPKRMGARLLPGGDIRAILDWIGDGDATDPMITRHFGQSLSRQDWWTLRAAGFVGVARRGSWQTYYTHNGDGRLRPLP